MVSCSMKCEHTAIMTGADLLAALKKAEVISPSKDAVIIFHFTPRFISEYGLSVTQLEIDLDSSIEVKWSSHTPPVRSPS